VSNFRLSQHQDDPLIDDLLNPFLVNVKCVTKKVIFVKVQYNIQIARHTQGTILKMRKASPIYSSESLILQPSLKLP